MSATGRTQDAMAPPLAVFPLGVTALNQHRPTRSALGRYAIEAELGRGAMGVVYRAVDLVLDRKVALKVVQLAFPAGEEEQRLMEQRFLHEARLAASLTHPNIVVVHDVGWDAEARTPFMALEYLEGRTLANVLASGPPMDWREALLLVSRLADALHYAHGNGIVHGDIKPANIMILPSGDAKIMDFSIARVATVERTATAECWGTPSYMSPEQACGEPMDGRSDLFSLGCVLYQLLTGRRPFEGDSVPQIMACVVHHEFLLPSPTKPGLPRDLDVVITRALAKDRNQRYPDGHAFAEDLQDVLHSRPLRSRDGLKTLPVLEPTAGCRPAAVGAAAAHLGTPPPKARPHRFGPAPLMAFGAGLAILALLGFRYATVDRTPASSVAPVAAAALGPPTTSAPVPSVPPPTASRLSSEPTVTAPAPKRSAVPMARRRPVPAALPARLALSVRHGVKQGRLRLWIDERLILDTELTSTETRKVLVFKKRSGSLVEVFDVAPGDRLVRVELEEDGQRRSAGLSGAFESRKTRLLEVKLGERVGLKWKS